MKKNAVSVQNLIVTGVFAALLAVLSQVAIPLPSGVPVTMQTFAVALAGFTLGARRGTLAVLTYLLLGAIGIPVFAGFIGGIGVFAGVTGGFLIGFLALAWLCGLGGPWFAGLGLIACHALGVLWFAVVAGVSPLNAAAISSLPYLLKDAVSVACAYFSARAVRRGLHAARLG